MSAPLYGPVEQAVKTWLLTTDLALLLGRTGGGVSIFLSMPKAAPIPVVTITLIGGGPSAGRDLPQSGYRLSFDCLGNNRQQASLLAGTLITELENLGVDGLAPTADGVTLCSAQTLGLRWLPDPDSDTPRYIVDALIITVL